MRWRISGNGCMIPAYWLARPRGLSVGLEEGLIMRHPSKPLLNKAIAYRAGAIGFGLLPIAMALAAAFIP
jgi:hypothetical protein